MLIFLGIWGEEELILGIWGAKANTFREMRTLFAGRRGDQCIIFRDLGSTDPPGGASETGADLDPNHLTSVTEIKVWGPAFSLSIRRFAVCQTWRTLQTQTRCCII